MRVTAERAEGGVRVIEKARLSGIAIVDDPAYSQSEIEARRKRGGGERRTWIRGGIKYGVEAHCACLEGADCDEVIFRPASLGAATAATKTDVLAITGRASDAVGSSRGGTLKLRDTDKGLDFEITTEGRSSAAGEQLQDLVRSGVNVYARPLIDDLLSEFTDAGGTRSYTKAHLRAILIKPIAGDEVLRTGWDPLVIPTDKIKKRRAKIWL